MAQIHISKDPPDKTPVVFPYKSLIRYIVVIRCGLKSKYSGLIKIGIVALEFQRGSQCKTIKPHFSDEWWGFSF